MARPRRPSSSGMRDEGGRVAELDAVGNGALHALEEEQAAEKDDEDGDGTGGKLRAGRLAVAGEGPAETVDHAGHGIQAVEPAITLRNERTRVGDRGGKHPELHEEGHDVTDVAIKR